MYYCHKHDVVHRDLKPENYCYVSKAADSELKLIDFGEALTVKEDEVHDDGVGTPYYVAPGMVFELSYTNMRIESQLCTVLSNRDCRQ